MSEYEYWEVTEKDMDDPLDAIVSQATARIIAGLDMEPVGAQDPEIIRNCVRAALEQAREADKQEIESHRQAQAAVYLALGPDTDPNRETWPDKIRELQAEIERLTKPHESTRVALCPHCGERDTIDGDAACWACYALERAKVVEREAEIERLNKRICQLVSEGEFLRTEIERMKKAIVAALDENTATKALTLRIEELKADAERLADLLRYIKTNRYRCFIPSYEGDWDERVDAALAAHEEAKK